VSSWVSEDDWYSVKQDVDVIETFEGSVVMNVVIFGLLAISLGLWGLSVWWWSVTELLRALMPIVLLSLGVVALASGVSSVRREHHRDDDDFLKDEGIE
jgi:hypothetical protein